VVIVSLSGLIVSLVSFVVFYSKVSGSVVFNRLVPFDVKLSLDSSVLFSLVLLLTIEESLLDVEFVP
jgi:hypothetical protein